jgi:hypothetical protein
MKSTIFLSVTTQITALMLAFANPAHAQSMSTETTRWAAFNLTITDTAGQPISGAQVMIGEDTNLPFSGNILTTDQNGNVEIPQVWRTAEPVTITAQGFVKATYLSLEPVVQTLQVRTETSSLVPAKRFELKGNTSGYGNLKNDGIFDIGLIVQAVPRAQLSTINIQSLISPETDHFTVLGQSADLPSNIAIPDQTESYIFPLKFSKPTYRLYLPTAGAWQIASLHARVPFSATVDALQNGKSIVDLVNSFDFAEASITPVTLAQPSTQQDVVVNQLPFAKTLSFTAPAYDPSLTLLAISLANTNGSYYPSDIKNVAPNGSAMLSAPSTAAADGMILAAFKKSGTKTTGPAADQYSAVTIPNNETRSFDPVRLVNPPQKNQDELVLDTPTAPAGLNPIMTYGVFSKVTLITQGKMKMETKEALWDVWAPNWVNKLSLPKNPLPPLGAGESLRWEVSFAAQFVGQKSLPPGPGELEKITHVTRSAVEL